MEQILIVTEVPNTAAKLCNPEELFKIKSNPFCQFPGRLFFGLESFRVHFNAENFLWKHAKGSNIYGGEDKDGKSNIRTIVQEQKFRMIVLFGGHALETISNEKLQLKDYLTCTPVPLKCFLSQFPSHGLKKLEINKCTPIAVFPHPSGQAANAWMDNSDKVCNCLTEVQRQCAYYFI